MPIETERRFLVDAGAIDLAPYACVDIEQRYVRHTGEWTSRTRRITAASAPERLTFTMKRDISDMSCDEIPMDLTTEAYDDLTRHAGPALLKTRWNVPHGDLVIEVDVYRNPELSGLMVAEVELPSEDTPFDPPAWLGREVTGDKALTNAALARSLEDRWMARTGMLPEWESALADVMQSEPVTGLKRFLRSEYVTGTEIMPPARNIFSALWRTAPKDVRVVILGQDPYPTAGNAHGLAFSVMPGVPVPASLTNIYKELHSDLDLPAPAHGHLAAWAEQGVMLLNTVLTVRRGEPDSHKGHGWEAITDEIVRTLARDTKPKVFILWGNKAGKKERLIDGGRHLVIRSPHPSPLSAHVGFFGSKPFSRTNRFLEEHGRQPIEWRLPEAAEAA